MFPNFWSLPTRVCQPKPIDVWKLLHAYNISLINTVFVQCTCSHLRFWPTMDSTLFFSLILFQGLVNCFVFDVEQNSTCSRSAYFMTRENKRLVGHVVKRLESDSLMSCGHLCLRNAWCTSTNFAEATSSENGKGTCELNKHGAINTDSELHEEQGVTFSMLQKVKSAHADAVIRFWKNFSEFWRKF